MDEYVSESTLIPEMPDLFERLELNVDYEITFKDKEALVGQLSLDVNEGRWEASIYSVKLGRRRTFQPDEVLSVTRLGVGLIWSSGEFL
ncbi:hypothetical protein CFN16_11425 [Pseudomonas fluorescens]|uniref:Uncharacterized protein n=1 Tax=Pseudomonas fluorescens TaxID=294 RepID=A0A345UW57_PSEFL|nr:hypothetical protein [Pseudomonas fluorescens]AXJ04709.1 hypothetical protein CFN16_11425 [Pseudomonas fluorescens]WJK12323.1 hypothetical protein QR290_13600 [Pseudomonas fluorescens]